MANALGGATALKLAKQMTSAGKGPVPWGGIAAPLDAASSSQQQAASESGPAAESKGRLSQLQGRAFCFLPLPLPTGLPVHVNGLFEVTNNRWVCCSASLVAGHTGFQ